MSSTLCKILFFFFVFIALDQPLSADDKNSEYRLKAEDKIKVTVFGQPDFSGEFVVDGEGNISLPMIQNVNAGGLTLAELESAIVDKLKPDYLLNPRISIEVLNHRPFYIIGEVKNPGSYNYVPGMTVVNAVALAGGYTYRAKTSEVEITKAADATKSKHHANPDDEISPGDVIEVPERFF
ncbi:MAG: polysaccharide biosynthesis/export family protein [Methylococcales bacterium]